MADPRLAFALPGISPGFHGGGCPMGAEHGRLRGLGAIFLFPSHCSVPKECSLVTAPASHIRILSILKDSVETHASIGPLAPTTLDHFHWVFQ